MRIQYLLTIAMVVAAIAGIIEWGNFLNSRLPTVYPPLTRDAAWWITTTSSLPIAPSR